MRLQHALAVEVGSQGRPEVAMEEITSFTCDAVGVSGTTAVFVKQIGENFEARVGLAFIGTSNMSDEELKNANPFDASFKDNYACGRGKTSGEAIGNLREEVRLVSRMIAGDER